MEPFDNSDSPKCDPVTAVSPASSQPEVPLGTIQFSVTGALNYTENYPYEQAVADIKSIFDQFKDVVDGDRGALETNLVTNR